ncbi:MAG: protoporphyrinogen oxidase [Xanthomonadales bacterium]|nr:protoporphyrinogen oxidase [Xanthomonadales bacterium]
MRTAIIGGGISGLATAFLLRQKQPDWTVHVYEREAQPGGTMRSVHQDGFIFERGSNGYLDNKPATGELVRAAGAEHLLLRSNDAARIRYVYTDAIHRLPDGPGAFLKTKLLTLGGKLRVAREFWIKPRQSDEEETLKSFGDRRLGPQFTDVFLNAMSAGIFGSTPEQLSVNAAFPLVVKLEREHGGLFRGMLAKRKKEAGPGGVLMSFVGGVSSFVDHLAGLMGDDLRLSASVTALDLADGRWRLQGISDEAPYDNVVLATPAYVSADLLRSVDAGLAGQLEHINYSPISVVGFGYHKLTHPLNGFGLLTTASAGLDILGVLWDSAIFGDRAPEGSKSVRVMIGGQRNPELALKEPDELVEIARRGVQQTMGITETPDTTFVQPWPRGIPNYRVGHLALVENLFQSADQLPGLFLNCNAYRGIGVNDCVEQSGKCVDRMLERAGAEVS